MSQENVEIVRRHHQAFVSGNREGALKALDPEIEFVFAALFELPAARGPAELEKAMRQWMGTWSPERRFKCGTCTVAKRFGCRCSRPEPRPSRP